MRKPNSTSNLENEEDIPTTKRTKKQPSPFQRTIAPLTFQRILKLFFCIIIDIIGFATYSIPVLGEFEDIIWAPISSIIIFYLFGSKLISLSGFMEEILPGSDFIPTATLAFLIEQMGWKLP